MDLPEDFHDKLAVLLREVTSAEVAKALVPLQNQVAHNGSEIQRLRRVIEGDNGNDLFNYGVKGAVEKVIRVDEDHNRRLLALEQKLDRVKWVLIGYAAGGGVLGGGLVAILIQAIGGG